MGRYLVRRILISIISLFGLITLCFFLVRCLPGGPFDDDIPLAPQVLAALNTQYGFDRPLFSQYLLFLRHLLQFDFGHSVLYADQSVTQVIARTLPLSFALGGAALIVSVIFGFVTAIFYFLIGPFSKMTLRFLHFSLLSAPALFLGPLLMLCLGLWWNLLPITVNDSKVSYILPILILAIRPSASIARLLIGSLEESLRQDWATMARAYGFSEKKILLKYALKQSLIPVFSYLGPAVAAILSGSLVVEMLFNVDGLGSQFVQSLINRDYALVVALTLMFGVLLIFGNLFFDLIIHLFDVRMERSG